MTELPARATEPGAPALRHGPAQPNGLAAAPGGAAARGPAGTPFSEVIGSLELADSTGNGVSGASLDPFRDDLNTLKEKDLSGFLEVSTEVPGLLPAAPSTVPAAALNSSSGIALEMLPTGAGREDRVASQSGAAALRNASATGAHTEGIANLTVRSTPLPESGLPLPGGETLPLRGNDLPVAQRQLLASESPLSSNAAQTLAANAARPLPAGAGDTGATLPAAAAAAVNGRADSAPIPGPSAQVFSGSGESQPAAQSADQGFRLPQPPPNPRIDVAQSTSPASRELSAIDRGSAGTSPTVSQLAAPPPEMTSARIAELSPPQSASFVPGPGAHLQRTAFEPAPRTMPGANPFAGASQIENVAGMRSSDPGKFAAALLDSAAIPTEASALASDGRDSALTGTQTGRPGALPLLGNGLQSAAGAPLTPFGSTGQVDTDALSGMLNQRIGLLVRNGIHSARVQLSPEHLGPVDIRVQIAEEGASVSFAAQSAAARDALEASLPRLRELFADQGLNLSGASVSTGDEHAAHHGTRGQAITPPGDSSAMPASAAQDLPVSSQPRPQAERLVDLFV